MEGMVGANGGNGHEGEKNKRAAQFTQLRVKACES